MTKWRQIDIASSIRTNTIVDSPKIYLLLSMAFVTTVT